MAAFGSTKVIFTMLGPFRRNGQRRSTPRGLLAPSSGAPHRK
jgi:hypothetical protein